jgi:hypothetical protein
MGIIFNINERDKTKNFVNIREIFRKIKKKPKIPLFRHFPGNSTFQVIPDSGKQKIIPVEFRNGIPLFRHNQFSTLDQKRFFFILCNFLLFLEGFLTKVMKKNIYIP